MARTKNKTGKDSHAQGGAEKASQQLVKQIAELRKKKGWSLEQLSETAHVSRSMLSQIERNRVNPTLMVALRIAHALGSNLSELLNIPDSSERIDVIQAGDTNYHFQRKEGCRLRNLSPLHLEKDVEFYELFLKPGMSLKSAPHAEGTREVLTVNKGSAHVTSGKMQCEITVGDSAHYAADVPHVIENRGKEDAVLYMVAIYR